MWNISHIQASCAACLPDMSDTIPDDETTIDLFAARAARRNPEALTAIELMQVLASVDPHTVISLEVRDADYDFTYVLGISAINEDGQVSTSRILNSWHGQDPFDPQNNPVD
jgi:hypothetical protein